MIEAVLLDDCAQVGTFFRPAAFLDDAARHVGDVERAVGSGDEIDGAKVRIGRADELGFLVGVAQVSEAGAGFDFGAADEAADRFAIK